MKKGIICLVFSMVVVLMFGISSRAEESGGVEAQLQAMQGKIDKLEKDNMAKDNNAKILESRISALEAEENKPDDDKGMISIKGAKLDIGGELEYEFVKTKKHAAVNEKAPYFQLDKFVLSAKAALSDDVYFKGVIEFYRTALEARNMVVCFNNLPQDSFLKVGIDDRFMAPDRKTERYPLSGNAFWRDTAQGIFCGGQLEDISWDISYTSGYEIDQRAITEDNSLMMLHDDRRTTNYTSPGEFGVGLGLTKDCPLGGKGEIMLFGYQSKMSAADETFLRTNVTGYASRKRDQSRYGINFNYAICKANLFAQLIQAQDGAMDRDAWYVQPSYKIKLADRDFFSSIEPLFRYGRLSTDINPAAGDILTWDREEFTFAILADLYKNTKLKTEYTIDRLDQGTAGTKNYGEFVIQLEVQF
ncbi:MAG: hypothetical protein ABII88_08535 [Candidatus Omnitrophota bacterium]